MSIKRLFNAVERRGDIGRRVAALALPISNRPRMTSSCTGKARLRETREHTTGPNLASRDNVAHSQTLYTILETPPPLKRLHEIGAKEIALVDLRVAVRERFHRANAALPRRRIKGRGRQRFSRTRGERVSVSVAAQKPEIDNGENDCRLAVEAVGSGARGDGWLGSAAPVDDG